MASEIERNERFDCDRWSCTPRDAASVPVSAAWNLRRPLPAGRLEELCSAAEVMIVRSAIQPQGCASRIVLSGSDFAAGGSAELYRAGAGWRIVWAQDLRGRRPWTWGHDPR